MNAIGFLVRKEFKNRLKELLHKPAKLILYIVIAAFLVFMLLSGTMMGKEAEGYQDIRLLQAGYLVILTFFVGMNLSAGLQRGATFFTMSDVNFLFVSPLNPKRILIFGLLKQMVTTFLTLLFLICYAGMLMKSFALTVGQFSLLVLGVMAALFGAQVLALFLYNLTNGHDQRVTAAKVVLCAIPVLEFSIILGTYLLNGQSVDALLAGAAGPLMDWVPFVGWLRAAVFAAIAGDFARLALFGGLFLLTLIVVLVLFVRSDADYYEDVLQTTEHNFALQRAAKEGRTSADAAMRSRKIKVRGTGLKGGWGASVFFYKHLLEQGRKDRFPFVGKSTLLTLACCLIGSLIIRNLSQQEGEALSAGLLMAICLVVAGYVQYFTQAVGPWTMELVKPYIYLIPEKPFHKLLWSVATTLVKPFVDGAVVFTVLCVVLGGNPLTALSCALCLGTLGMAFVSVSVLSERIFGKVQNKGLVAFFYLMVLCVVVLPGVIGSVVLCVIGLENGVPGFVCGLPAIVWNLLVSIGIFAACQNILANTELQN